MKAAVALLFVACAAAAAQAPPEKIARPGDYVFTLDHDGLERRYKVHVPPQYDPARPTPLVISLHGGGGSMEYQASDENYGQISKADHEGFVVVFPNGYSRFPGGKFATWNAGRCCGPARDRNVDDVGFLRKLVERLGVQLNVDRKRVFATGMSNGAMMAHRLACEAPDLVAAIAPVAGTDNTETCNPARPVPVLEFHARNDENLPFEGGRGKKSRAGAVTDFTSVPETVSRWVRRNGCEAKPRRVLDRPGAWCERYSGCRDPRAEVELCVTETGAHSWPGAKRTRGDEPASTAISANDLMWDFFVSR